MEQQKPIHAKPSLYAYYFEIIKEIGLKYGYNIVLHGSMNRDLDLIAIPWQEVIGDKTAMLNEIVECIGGSLVEEAQDNIQAFKQKYHGRESYIININRRITSQYNGMSVVFEKNLDPQYYIDISFTPRFSKPTEEQLTEVALLFAGDEEGFTEQEASNILAALNFVVDRLFDNGNVKEKSIKERLSD